VKLLLILLLVAGCSARKDPDYLRLSVEYSELAVEVKNLERRIIHTEYEQVMERCFVNLTLCELKGGKDCMETHIACVVQVEKIYDVIRKKRGL